MKKLTALAAFVSLTGPATAEILPDPAHEVVTRDGITYDYMTTTNSRGDQEIVGRDSRGDRFRLHVAGSIVSGWYGGDPISFTIRRHPVASVGMVAATH
jgi:hypothetical protein